MDVENRKRWRPSPVRLSETPRVAPRMTHVHLTIQYSQSLIRWLDSAIDGVELQANDRVRIAGACLDLAMEHHKAIVVLAAHQLFGSAFALARPVFEAYVRGVWLHRCASRADKRGRGPRWLSGRHLVGREAEVLECDE
jgi:hypothetical protein